MGLTDKLRIIRDDYVKTLKVIDETIVEVESSDLHNENQSLRISNDQLSKELDSLKDSINILREQNSNLRLKLNEQILDEKINILKISRNKLVTYFNREKSSALDRLTAFEVSAKSRIGRLQGVADKISAQEGALIKEKLDLVQNELTIAYKEHCARVEEEHSALIKETDLRLKGFKEEPLDEETVIKRMKQTRFEMNIGLYVPITIGIILILIGIGIFAYWQRSNINNFVKSGSIFLLGIILLGAGEYLFRKQKNFFFQGVIGGGVAVLFTGVFLGYFVLNVFRVFGSYNLLAALFLSVLVSAYAVIASLRYNSKTVITYGLIGGYLPFLTYILTTGFSGNAFYYAMGYLLFLNSAVLVISFRKQWFLLNYISFFCNLPSIVYLAENSPVKVIGVVYIAIAFIMYLSIILLYPLTNRKSLGGFEVGLLALNTVFTGLEINILLNDMGLGYLNGYLAIVFCLLFAALGYICDRLIKKERITILLFYITSVAFSALAVFQQAGVAWVTLGWMIEGIILFMVGHYKRIRIFERSGLTIIGICAGFFFFLELVYGSWLGLFQVRFFDLKYFTVVSSLTSVFIIYQIDMIKARINPVSTTGKDIISFKYLTIVNLYIALIYFAVRGFLELRLHINGYPRHYLDGFYSVTIAAIVSIVYGMSLELLKKYIGDKMVTVFKTIFMIAGSLFSFGLIFRNLNNVDNPFMRYISIAVLLGYLVLAVFTIRHLLRSLYINYHFNLEFYPVIIGITAVFYITLFSAIQISIDNVSLLISFIYLIMAVLFIVFGFIKKFIYIRFAGLFLAFLSLLILLINVFTISNTPVKILSTMLFGFIIIGISFLYQHIHKKLGN